MTREDTVKLMTMLKAAYPHSYKGLTKPDAEAMLALWQRLFSGDDPAEVFAAVDALISTRTVGYSPTPGEVKEQMQKLKRSNDLDELAAWALVSKACRNGLYGYREEFAKLPPDVQTAVGAPEQLRAWAMMDTDTVESVVASNFQRNYRVRQARQKELEKLPSNVMGFIQQVSNNLMIGGPYEQNDE